MSSVFLSHNSKDKAWVREEVLQALSSTEVRMGICTPKQKDFATKILDMFGLLSQFCLVDDGNVDIKKREQIAGLLRSTEIDQSAVMFDDRTEDISSAKANGLRSAGVFWGLGDLAELEGAGTEVLLRSTNELRQFGI